MKSLIIVIIFVVIIMLLWTFLLTYMDNSMEALLAIMSLIEANIIDNDWDGAQNNLDRFSDEWHEYKKIYSLFIDEHVLMCIDRLPSECRAFIQYKEAASALSVLYLARYELKSIYDQELLTMNNII